MDPVTGGTLEEDVVPSEIGYYAENVYFPFDRQPIQGPYLIQITGSSDTEFWVVEMIYDGEEIMTLSGNERRTPIQGPYLIEITESSDSEIWMITVTFYVK